MYVCCVNLFYSVLLKMACPSHFQCVFHQLKLLFSPRFRITKLTYLFKMKIHFCVSCGALHCVWYKRNKEGEASHNTSQPVEILLDYTFRSFCVFFFF